MKRCGSFYAKLIEGLPPVQVYVEYVMKNPLYTPGQPFKCVSSL